jgi:hypothetical protein
MRAEMTVHAFVDETKDRGYLVAAAVLQPEELAHARRVLAGLLLPGQRRLHLVKERDSRRGQIVAAMAALPVEAIVYDASERRRGRDQRAACLSDLVCDLLSGTLGCWCSSATTRSWRPT